MVLLTEAVMKSRAVILSLALVVLMPYVTGCTTGTPNAAPSSAAATTLAGSTSPSTPPSANGAWCTAGDLRVAPIVPEGAMGHLGYPIIVINTTGTACKLPGGTPVVLYRTSNGTTALLPTKPAQPGTPAPDYTLAAGMRARTALYTINGYGGYSSSGPECAHPATYHDLSVKLKGGDAVALTGFVLDVKCGDIQVYNWAAA